MVEALLRENYSQIRQRLMQPARAVQDKGIELKKSAQGVTGYEAQEIARAAFLEAERARRERAVEVQAEALKNWRRPRDWLRVGGGDILPESPTNTKLSTRYVIETVSKYYSLGIKHLQSEHRDKQVVEPRHVAMYLCREHAASRSYPQLAKAFCRLDHTTVRSACLKIQRMIADDPSFAAKIEDITRRLKMCARPQDIHRPIAATDKQR